MRVKFAIIIKKINDNTRKNNHKDFAKKKT